MSDQLRWKIAADASVVLDGAERVSLDVRGQRAELTPAGDMVLAEALRQARATQLGRQPASPGPALRGEIMARAVLARYDDVRAHITAAVTRHLAIDATTGVYPGRAEAVAAEAMTGLAPLFAAVVTTTADGVLRQLADDPRWRTVLGVTAEDARAGRLAELSSFAESVARMLRDGEPDGEGGRFVMENDDSYDTLTGLIGDARALLGWPDPAEEPDLDGETPDA